MPLHDGSSQLFYLFYCAVTSRIVNWLSNHSNLAPVRHSVALMGFGALRTKAAEGGRIAVLGALASVAVSLTGPAGPALAINAPLVVTEVCN